MRSSMRFVGVLVAVQLLVSCYSPVSGPEAVISKFVHAFNDKDMNVMLSCVDPRQERLFRGTFQLIERFTGLPVEIVLDIMPGLAQLIPEQQLDEVRFLEMKTLDRRVADGTAEITVSLVVVERSRGHSRSSRETVAFTLRHFEEHGWRIVGARKS